MSLLLGKTEQRLKACENCGHQKGKHHYTRKTNKACFQIGCDCQEYIFNTDHNPHLVLFTGRFKYQTIKGKVKEHRFVKLTPKNIGLTLHTLIHFNPELEKIQINLHKDGILWGAKE